MRNSGIKGSDIFTKDGYLYRSEILESKKPMILAIETSTPVCSVALQIHDGRVMEKRIKGQGVHSEYTFLFIRELLSDEKASVEDLKLVLFSNGPGSYTGLRIGSAAIKGLLFNQGIPLYTVPTLFSFTVPILRDIDEGTVHGVINARRTHLYHQKIVKQENGELNLFDPRVENLAEIEKEIKPGDIIVGTGWERLNASSLQNVKKMGLEAVSAKNLIAAWTHETFKEWVLKTDVEQFEPDYLNMAQINNSPIHG